MRESANAARIAVHATGQAFLVMSVTAHRYWSATIDGKPAVLVPTNIAYQGIVVPAGDHVIEMRYRNPMVWVGAAITLLALLGLAFIARAWPAPATAGSPAARRIPPAPSPPRKRRRAR